MPKFFSFPQEKFQVLSEGFHSQKNIGKSARLLLFPFLSQRKSSECNTICVKWSINRSNKFYDLWMLVIFLSNYAHFCKKNLFLFLSILCNWLRGSNIFLFANGKSRLSVLKKVSFFWSIKVLKILKIAQIIVWF